MCILQMIPTTSITTMQTLNHDSSATKRAGDPQTVTLSVLLIPPCFLTVESDCQNKLLRNPDTPFLKKLNSEFVLKASVSYTGIMPVRYYLYIKPDLLVKTMFQHTPPKVCNRGTLLGGGGGCM